MKSLLLICGAVLVLSFGALWGAYAGSATWNLNPTSGDWNTAANWTPVTVPNGPSDVASFALTNQPDVTLAADTEVSSIVYNTGASSYNTTISAGHMLTIANGITNNSGVAQN